MKERTREEIGKAGAWITVFGIIIFLNRTGLPRNPALPHEYQPWGLWVAALGGLVLVVWFVSRWYVE